MKLRVLINLILPLALAACAQRGEDVTLTPGKVSPPAAYSSVTSAAPYVRTWADFEAYRSASVEAYRGMEWDGERAVPGRSIAITLSEGSRLENTTAHPQYFDLWLQIPPDLPVGQPYALRRASDRRAISRTTYSSSDPDSKTDYSLLKDGEMTLSGMRGYDAPRLRKSGRPVATLTVTKISPETIEFHLRGNLPVREDLFGPRHYSVKVDRTYTATFKPLKVK